MSSSFFANPVTIEGNVLFLSDAHFGVPSAQESARREELLIQLLQSHREALHHLFLLGDIFDFWFEYYDVIPKGYYRLFNTLYELKEMGTKIYYFTGNHDMWVTSYFKQEFDCQVFYEQRGFVINGKRVLLGHGDGIGGRQTRYRFTKSVLAYPPNRWLYSLLHPRWSFGIARYCSKKSRASHPNTTSFQGESEFQVQFAREVLKKEQVDFFIYGHRHAPAIYPLTDRSVLYNTGDWLSLFSYVVFNQHECSPALLYFKRF